jgi:RNA polymerase primary sigma factor
MGNISILSRDEEVELAKSLEDGKRIIEQIVTKLPLYRRLEGAIDQDNGDAPDEAEDERAEKVLEMTLKALEDLMLKLEIEDGKVARYG